MFWGNKSTQSPGAWGTRRKLGERLFPATAEETAACVAAATTVAAAMELHWPYGDTRRFKVVIDGATDNTAKVQLAINSLPATGGAIFNPRGAQFNMRNLDCDDTPCLHFRHFANDDTDTARYYRPVSNELIEFLMGANVDGVVNEIRQTAPFNLSPIVDIRKSLALQDAHLGVGQDRIDPVRAYPMLLCDDGHEKFSALYKQYCTTGRQNFNGISMQGWTIHQTLNGVGSSAFTIDPLPGDLISGNTSGERGIVVKVEAGSLLVRPLHRFGFTSMFEAGETITCLRPPGDNEVSSGSISSIDDINNLLSFPLPEFGQCLTRGHWGFGVPQGLMKGFLNVGGRLIVGPDREFGQYQFETRDTPTIGLINSWDSPDLAISKDIVLDESTGRIYSRAMDGSTNQSRLDATRGGGECAHGGAITKGFNFSTFTNTGTGLYELVLENVVNAYDGLVFIQRKSALDNPMVLLQENSGGAHKIHIRNYLADGSTLANLNANIYVKVEV